MPVHQGQGPGLSVYSLGETLGTDTVSLVQREIPQHTHQLSSEDPAVGSADTSLPGSTAVLAASTGGFAYRPDATAQPVPMSAGAVSVVGGGQPHNNLQPYLTLNFCIALQGIFPPRQ